MDWRHKHLPKRKRKRKLGREMAPNKHLPKRKLGLKLLAKLLRKREMEMERKQVSDLSQGIYF